jgi:ABC-2 type transport system permease protein
MTGTIARHEFLFTVKRPAYLILTLGMPVIVLAYAGIIAMLAMIAAPAAVSQIQSKIGVVDEADLLRYLPPLSKSDLMTELKAEATSRPSLFSEDTLKKLADKSERATGEFFRRRMHMFPKLDDAMVRLDRRQVEDVFVIPEDYVETGELRQYTRQWKLLGSTPYGPALQQLLAEAMMRRSGMTTEAISRGRGLPTVHIFERQFDGEYSEVNKLQRGINIGVPVAVIVILLVSLAINAGFLSTGIAEEKENKVLEILLSSVLPRELLMGKVIGMGAAALLQLAVWLMMAGIFPMILMAAIRQKVPFEFHVELFVFGAIFFVLGFLFYGALLVGFGSLGNNLKECQQFAVFVVLLPILPVFLMIPFIIESPDNTVIRIVSYIPFFTPTLMMLRLGVGTVAPWELVVAIILMIGSTWFAILFSARLFKVGILQTGKPFSPLAILRMFLRPG